MTVDGQAVEDAVIVTEEFVPMGPAASQVAIKQTGTNGGADGFESGQLTAEFSENESMLQCKKLNVSGTDYETIRDITLKIPVRNSSAVSEYQELFSAISPQCSYIAVERTELIEEVFCDISQQSEDTYYTML